MSALPPRDDVGHSRRSALKLLAANIALVTAACGKPMQEIVPYVHMPERLVPGIPLQFATTLPLGGYGRGVVCTSVEGRPIKVSGNPLHPASLGSTDVFAEAHVLSLYDPDRSDTCRREEEIVAYVDLQTALAAQLARIKARGGDGLRLLTGPVSSPTLLRQIGELRALYPGFRWHVHDPLEDRAARRGAQLAFGRDLVSLPRLAEAAVIVTLDADPLGPGPAQIVHGRGFADRRRVRGGAGMNNRLYAFASVPSATAAKADHRTTLTPGAIGHVAQALARALGADLPDPELDAGLKTLIATVAAELNENHNHAVVLVGPSQPAEVHALAHWINGRIAAPVTALPPLDAEAKSLEALLDDIDGGGVTALVVSGTNPAYSAPVSARVGERFRRCPFTLHHGITRDETSGFCAWHVPASHELESWGDLRAPDGTPSLVQPLMRAAARHPHPDVAARRPRRADGCGGLRAHPRHLARSRRHRRLRGVVAPRPARRRHRRGGRGAAGARRGAPARTPVLYPRLPRSRWCCTRSDALRRILRQQRLAAGMPQTAHQGCLGQYRSA